MRGEKTIQRDVLYLNSSNKFNNKAIANQSTSKNLQGSVSHLLNQII